MGRYSIKDLEKLSGIKAHTIRIWEKRYKLVTPQRTSTNIRFYSDDDLKRILNVSLLNHNGYKISRIAKLSEEEINQKVEEHTIIDNNFQFHIDRLIVSMVDMEEDEFEKCLDECILTYGLEQTMIDILYPFFSKVGTLWMTGSINPGQEHLISNIVRSKLILAIDRKSKSVTYKEEVALFVLPENEWHELGLLFHQFIAINCGIRVIYLGQSVPLKTIQSVIKARQVHYIVVSNLSVRDPDRLHVVLTRISEAAKKSKVILIDKSKVALELKDSNSYRIAKNIEEFKKMLNF